MARHVVAAVSDVPPGSASLVRAGGREIALFNVDGDYYALKNQCPHQGGPLCSGFVTGHLRSSRPGHYEYDGGRRLVKCPWHGWEFDLETGRSWFDPRGVRVRSYPVRVEAGGRIAAESPELQPGPYVAETIPVSVEGEYVVVELGR